MILSANNHLSGRKRRGSEISKRSKSTHEFNQKVHNLSIFTDTQNEMIATAKIVVEFPLAHVNITL